VLVSFCGDLPRVLVTAVASGLNSDPCAVFGSTWVAGLISFVVAKPAKVKEDPKLCSTVEYLLL